MAPVVTLLTDYGPGSEHVGALHAVIAAACPAADRIDLAHDVPPGDVRWGGLLLARLVPLAPPGAHLAVVDPGVGTERRGLAVACRDGRYLVGPDNGLLGMAAHQLGARDAVELTSVAHRREPVAATFHGRDVFAPAAAHLARGGALGDLGDPVALATIVAPPLPAAESSPGRLCAVTVGRDRFGNLSLLAGPDDLAATGLCPGSRVVAVLGDRRHEALVGRVFSDAPRGGLLVYLDSHDMVALAVSGGSAAARLGAESGEVVAIEAARATGT